MDQVAGLFKLVVLGQLSIVAAALLGMFLFLVRFDERGKAVLSFMFILFCTEIILIVAFVLTFLKIYQ